jgi:hypothetical protein
VIVQLEDGTVYDSLDCAACDVESGSAAEYRSTLNGTVGFWRASHIDILTKQDGLREGLNTIVIEGKGQAA